MNTPVIKPVVTICTPDWSPEESYGRIAIQLSDHFSKQGYHVNEMGEYHRKKIYIPSMGAIFLAYPTHYRDYGPLPFIGKKIALTMFESTRLPEGWVDALNEMDWVIAPSTFVNKVFLDEGVNPEKLLTQRLGISKAFTIYKKRKVTHIHRYLAFIDRGRRKGWDTAFQAFQMLYKKYPNCHLTLKGKKGALPYAIKSEVPNTTIVETDFSDNELAEFYAQHEVLLNPNTGEGFGFLPREFAGTGGIPVTTDFGGTADGIKSWGIPIDYQLVSAWPFHDAHPGLGEWAQPDIFDLSKKLEHVHLNIQEYLKKAESWSQHVKDYYSWEPLCQMIQELWETA